MLYTPTTLYTSDSMISQWNHCLITRTTFTISMTTTMIIFRRNHHFLRLRYSVLVPLPVFVYAFHSPPFSLSLSLTFRLWQSIKACIFWSNPHYYFCFLSRNFGRSDPLQSSAFSIALYKSHKTAAHYPFLQLSVSFLSSVRVPAGRARKDRRCFVEQRKLFSFRFHRLCASLPSAIKSSDRSPVDTLNLFVLNI